MEKTQKWLDEQFVVRPVFARTTSYIAVMLYLALYVASGLLNAPRLHSLLTFDVSSGVFWLFIILIAMGYIDFFREIVKDVARNKVGEFASTAYYSEAFSKLREDLLADSDFRTRMSDTTLNKFVEGDPSTSGNKARSGK